MLELIISGGQSGADLAGNIFAMNFGIDTEIRTFKSFRPRDLGDYPLYAHIRKHFIPELDSADYVPALRARTHHNVINSHATLIFVHDDIKTTKGSLLTYNLARQEHRPVFIISESLDVEYTTNIVVSTLIQHHPRILNIAGERDMDKDFVVGILSAAYMTAMPSDTVMVGK